MKFVPARARAVVSAVCDRLASVGRHEPVTDVIDWLGSASLRSHWQAIDLLLGVDMVQEAINACILVGNWKKARALAKDASPDIAQFVEQKVPVVVSYNTHANDTVAQYISTLKQGRTQDDAIQLANVDAGSALENHAARGEWDQCLKLASQQGAAVLTKYAALYAANLVQQGVMRAHDCRVVVTRCRAT